MYILLNRENVVIDILNYIRYAKLQFSNGIVVACKENEATGVIGSDCNTFYTLMKSDTNNLIDAIRVVKYQGDPADIEVGVTKYDTEKKEYVCRYSLDELKSLKQAENNAKLADYLNQHPLTWQDGKQYGVTKDDQIEIQMMLSQLNIAEASKTRSAMLEWHAKREENTLWTEEDLTNLLLDISDYVYPYYHLCQSYKNSIYNAESIEELKAINLAYEDEEETSEEEES